MSSTLSWIDFDSAAHQRAHRILMLFRERDTRDELGLGPIRDAISDTLFPGTSTIHTRLRYMLFVPWVYMELERKGVPSNRIREQSRFEQLRLAKVLKSNAPGELGVIGGDVGDRLKTLPSAIYWNGLQRWGLRVYPGSEGQYQQAVDEIHRRRKKAKLGAAAALELGDDVGGLWETGAYSFHPGLPNTPVGFPENAAFQLTRSEAGYLQERLRQSAGDSLLSDLMANPVEVETGAPWAHPHLSEFRPEHRDLLWHGRHFSDIAQGAAILYNQLLAKERHDEGLLAQHRDAGQAWLEALEGEFQEVARWAGDLSLFWRSVENRGHAIGARTMVFVEAWIDMVMRFREALFEQSVAQALIRNREIEKKHRNSRFTNTRVLDQWGGQSGMTPMVYRWPIVKSYIADMAHALRAGQ